MAIGSQVFENSICSTYVVQSDAISDHVAALNAFQSWEGMRQRGEQVEFSYCENKGLNVSVLRTTWEAKNQLKVLMLVTSLSF